MTPTRAVAAVVGLVVLASLVALRHVEARPVLRTVAVGAWPVALAVDAQAGHIFVVNHSTRTTPGSVSMLDAGTGAILRTAPLAGDSVAVDGRAGRVFVADSVLDASR